MSNATEDRKECHKILDAINDAGVVDVRKSLIEFRSYWGHTPEPPASADKALIRELMEALEPLVYYAGIFGLQNKSAFEAGKKGNAVLNKAKDYNK